MERGCFASAKLHALSLGRFCFLVFTRDIERGNEFIANRGQIIFHHVERLSDRTMDGTIAQPASPNVRLFTDHLVFAWGPLIVSTERRMCVRQRQRLRR